jgi:hypothetical protein
MKAAKACEVALCGGCAAAVTKGITDYEPKDIDFAATRENALKFVGMINGFMLGRSVHYRIYVNSQNDFVPSAATAHFRITCGFWLPVCLFVIPDESFRAYRIKGGHMLQLYSDIKQAADELTAEDQKTRIANEPEDAPPTVVDEAKEDETPASAEAFDPLAWDDPHIDRLDPFPPERIGSGRTP